MEDSLRLAKFFSQYPELKRILEDSEAHDRGFCNGFDLRACEKQLTVEEQGRWANGTKADLELILTERETSYETSDTCVDPKP